ncbi:MAG: hypothetical protein ACRDD1_14970, partial [Planctomycetia bacterium]
MALRLTLRTLLAYLDQTLSPADAADIGTKLTESTAARQLSNRIERLRRPVSESAVRSKPRDLVSGSSTLDLNRLAAYLDNVLPESEVAGFEQQCLSDDAALQETASVHHLLSVVLNQSAHVPPEARERLKGELRERKIIDWMAPVIPASDADTAIIVEHRPPRTVWGAPDTPEHLGRPPASLADPTPTAEDPTPTPQQAEAPASGDSADRTPQKPTAAPPFVAPTASPSPAVPPLEVATAWPDDDPLTDRDAAGRANFTVRAVALFLGLTLVVTLLIVSQQAGTSRKTGGAGPIAVVDPVKDEAKAVDPKP